MSQSIAGKQIDRVFTFDKVSNLLNICRLRYDYAFFFFFLFLFGLNDLILRVMQSDMLSFQENFIFETPFLFATLLKPSSFFFFFGWSVDRNFETLKMLGEMQFYHFVLGWVGWGGMLDFDHGNYGCLASFGHLAYLQ